MRLAHALRINRMDRLALVGAGGKTTALFKLARELPLPVIVTATTHLGFSQLALADRHFIAEDQRDIQRAEGAISQEVCLFTGPPGADNRTEGIGEAPLESLRRLADKLGCPLLIEADGSRQRPLKAPAGHEPAIPPWVNHVAVVAGLTGLGKPIGVDWIHRPEIFARLSGLHPGEGVTAQSIVQVLTHPEGGLKNIPVGASRSVILNQADTSERRLQGEEMAKQLLGFYHSILVGSLVDQEGAEKAIRSVWERTAGIILAAGGSKRFGQPKQLLEWQGKPLTRHVVEIAIQAGLAPVIVVLGADSQRVSAALEGMTVVQVENPKWEAGQSTSVTTGVRALPGDVGSTVFLVVDQPYANAPVIRELIKAHSHSRAHLVAPMVDGQRTNPVLFDRDTFPDLLRLEGDTGGRAIFNRYPLEFVPWSDPRLLMDIDTLADYELLKRLQ